MYKDLNAPDNKVFLNPLTTYGIAISMFAADQIAKQSVINSFQLDESMKIFSWLHLTYVVNRVRFSVFCTFREPFY